MWGYMTALEQDCGDKWTTGNTKKEMTLNESHCVWCSVVQCGARGYWWQERPRTRCWLAAAAADMGLYTHMYLWLSTFTFSNSQYFWYIWIFSSGKTLQLNYRGLFVLVFFFFLFFDHKWCNWLPGEYKCVAFMQVSHNNCCLQTCVYDIEKPRVIY